MRDNGTSEQQPQENDNKDKSDVLKVPSEALVFHRDVPVDTRTVISCFFDLVTCWLLLDTDNLEQLDVPFPTVMGDDQLIVKVSLLPEMITVGRASCHFWFDSVIDLNHLLCSSLMQK